MAEEASSQRLAYLVFLTGVRLLRAIVFFAFEREQAQDFIDKNNFGRTQIIEVKYDQLRFDAESRGVKLVNVADVDKANLVTRTENITHIHFSDRA